LFSDRDALTQKGKQQHKRYHGYTLRTIDRCNRAGSFQADAGKSSKSLGFISNLMAIVANKAVVLEGYLALGAVFEKDSFTARERQIFLLTLS
jgi:hypothetical protein